MNVKELCKNLEERVSKKVATTAFIVHAILALSGCETRAAPTNTAQAQINIAFDQPGTTLVLGVGSSFSLPAEGKRETTFRVGPGDVIFFSGDGILLPNGTFKINDENQACEVKILGQDRRSDTPVTFKIQCKPPQR